MVERVDVLVVGAGPAGAVAALLLARAGVRVTLLDRARFPRDKLCGDTLNPGTLAILRRLGLEAAATHGALALTGMRLTGPGVSVEATYPRGLTAAAITRRALDARLLEAAIAAGARFEDQVAVASPLLRDGPKGPVAGVVTRREGEGVRERTAAVTIAADGRSSILASSLGLSSRPRAPRRWAIGSYYEGVEGLGNVGEMHVRPGHYIGVAPVPGGAANAILVLTAEGARRAGAPLATLLQRALDRDPQLAPRFAGARPLGPPVILGPLAVDVHRPGRQGLVLAGDAAGFIDPMTGDGIRFALGGAELAAGAALEALEHGWEGLVDRLALARSRAFGSKWRFNRTVRALTGSRLAVRGVAATRCLSAPLVARAVVFAGDCPRPGAEAPAQADDHAT